MTKVVLAIGDLIGDAIRSCEDDHLFAVWGNFLNRQLRMISVVVGCGTWSWCKGVFPRNGDDVE